MQVCFVHEISTCTSVLKLGKAKIQTIIAIKANIRLYCMVDNTCIDTSIQKAGIPGLYGWVEHKGYIKYIIKEKRERMKNFVAVWFDPARQCLCI